MNLDDLIRALTAFADDASDLDLTGGHLIVQIGDELIDADVEEIEGTLYITEGGEKSTAFRWLVNRIARIPQLADRILDHIESERYFVRPSGTLTNYLNESPDEREVDIANVPDQMPHLLSATPGSSSVLYVTSEAGEGKTTLINELARSQAKKYKAKRTTWLLVPISLGGRAFMTFDDIVVAELVNKLRFHLFHYEAFLEMVRLGVLVPAFDGFEEMFVAGASGEALSALGTLITDLGSCGTVLVAARIAYFKYRNFRIQARLFDSISDGSVDFAQLDLNRWDRNQFLNYAKKRQVPDGRRVYELVRSALGEANDDHPLLTRAVLVARLLDVSVDYGIDHLLEQLRANRDDYFHQFIGTMIKREATRKWIDQNTPHQPLLSEQEHHLLLAELAKEMWITSNDALRGEYLDLIADLFADEVRTPLQIRRQIIQRFRDHALLSKAPSADAYRFDHDDFRRYYLGVAIANLIAAGDRSDLSIALGKAELSPISIDSTLNAVKRDGGDLRETLKLLQSLTARIATSYVADNTALLALRSIEMINEDGEFVIASFMFPPDSLRKRYLQRVRFEACEFQQTSLEGANIDDCCFSNCTIHQLEIPMSFHSEGVVFDRCDIRCLVTHVGHVYDPSIIGNQLVTMGFSVVGVADDPVAMDSYEPDEETKIAERALRVFMRATQVNENVFRQKLGGNQTALFFRVVLSKMLEKGVIRKVPFRGRGTRQERYQLAVPMRQIDSAIPIGADVSTLEEFLDSIVSGDLGHS